MTRFTFLANAFPELFKHARKAEIHALSDPLDFPEDISWRSLKEQLMHRTLALANTARSTDRHISAASDFASPPDFNEIFEARQEGYARIGLEALYIVDDLRKQFRITVNGSSALNTEWEPKEFLRGEISKIEQRRREWQKIVEARTADPESME